MSFFGFDSTLPRDRNQGTRSYGQQRPLPDDADIERYDGLADQMDETDDVLNDETFGGDDVGATTQPVGRDFDFFGQTAKVSDAISEEQMRFTRQQPVSKVVPTTSVPFNNTQQPGRQARTDYRNSSLDDLRPDDDLWGSGPPKTQAYAPPPSNNATGGRKMMSLAEVEATMRAQAKKPAQQPAVTAPPGFQQHQQGQFAPMPFPMHQSQQYPGFPHAQHFPPQGFPPQPHQFPQQQQPLPQQQFQQQGPPLGMQQQQQQQQFAPPRPLSGQYQDQQRQAPLAQQQPPIQILRRTQAPSPSNIPATAPPTTQPMQILQNPARASGPEAPPLSAHRHTDSGIVTHPQQLPNLTEDERAAYLAEDAKRAKRNHKIFLLSKDNGMMTPQDKNFITRIQLQQLVTATGNPNEPNQSPLAEDFYYQVHNQIRGGPRQHPGQPLSNFAQTYLFQTGGRHGGMRRQARGGDNHMQRMEQQVQRAVDAAKNKPKNKQLVIEGSLGKISFSNSKTPKPLLNFKRMDSEHRKAPHVVVNDRKTVLRDIENVYNTLLEIENHHRERPPPLSEDLDPALVQLNLAWDQKDKQLNEKLWKELRVHEPIGAPTTHPFIAFMSFSKGKKAIPRVFRYIDHDQRTTLLTMIVVHLDQLDVVHQALLAPGQTQLNAGIRENVDLFSMAVLPVLFSYVSEAPLDIVDALLSLTMTRTNIEVVARTRVGISMLTMILSRAEIIKQDGTISDEQWNLW